MQLFQFPLNTSLIFSPMYLENDVLYNVITNLYIYLQICQLQIYVNHMQKLKLSDQEFAYMKALALFSPGEISQILSFLLKN